MTTKIERTFVLEQAAEARNRGMVLVLVLGNDQSEEGEALSFHVVTRDYLNQFRLDTYMATHIDINHGPQSFVGAFIAPPQINRLLETEQEGYTYFFNLHGYSLYGG